jgi:RimJ/RimL family protein N-acetyltransferase
MLALETERLLLRQMNMDDVENLQGIFSDPEAMRYYPGIKDRRETEDWIQWNMSSYQKYGFGLWVAILKVPQQFAGQCGLIMQEVEGRQEVEIGYLFLRKFWGQGLATEAARACRDYAVNRLGHTRLISLIDPGNLASRRVAEKVGMSVEKEIVKWSKRLCVYALSAEERSGA